MGDDSSRVSRAVLLTRDGRSATKGVAAFASQIVIRLQRWDWDVPKVKIQVLLLMYGGFISLEDPKYHFPGC